MKTSLDLFNEVIVLILLTIELINLPIVSFANRRLAIIWKIKNFFFLFCLQHEIDKICQKQE